MASGGGSIKDRILALLAEAGPPLDDDQIAARIGVVRQQVNDRCRQLARSRQIVRGRDTDAKIVNRRVPSSPLPARPPASSASTPPTGGVAPRADEPSDWFWEGHVQARLRDHFVVQGWRLLRESNCLLRERGIDLLLERHGAQLAIEVKGFPSSTYGRGPLKGQPKPTQPTLQAKHWFAEALLAAIRILSKHPEYAVAVGFPDMPRYRSLIESTGHALTRLGLGVFLVQDGGPIVEVLAPTAPSEPR
jgi:hypothetical protein